MPKFGSKSIDRLATCHPDIQKVMNEVIKHYDFKVEYGTRSVEEQFFLFKKGRKYIDGKWVVVGRKDVVTGFDGIHKLSKHNHSPSLAIDIVPYPVDWKDLERFKELKKVVFKCAKELGITLVWGADWDSDGNIKEHKLQDYPHYEITV